MPGWGGWVDGVKQGSVDSSLSLLDCQGEENVGVINILEPGMI